MLMTIVAALLVLGPVIVFHEFGHFLVAKLSGICVKVFSVGFGPKILKLRFGETQYALSIIPFGGYVKMAGHDIEEPESEPETTLETTEETPSTPEPVSPRKSGPLAFLYAPEIEDDEVPEDRYFRNKSLFARLAVVTGGPIANLVLAIVVLTGVQYNQGIPVLATTTLGVIAPESEEAAAGLRDGDVVLEVKGTPVGNTMELEQALVALADAPFPIRVQRGPRDTTLVLPGVRREEGQIVFPRWTYRLDTRIGLVKRGGPAWEAGIRPGDRIVAIGGQNIQYYDELADLINPAIDQELDIRWERDGALHTGTVTPEADEAPVEGSLVETRTLGRIQIEPYHLVVPISMGGALRTSVLRSWGFIRDTGRFLWIVVQGKGTRDAIGGPIRIGQVAGSALRWGPSMLFFFMAFFSVNLFLLNLLPIPVLDGGHVLFLVIEGVRGRALSLRVQERLLKVGVSALIALMGYVVFMDLLRVFTR